MVEYLPRSAWGARAPRPGPGNLTPSRVEGDVLHWPGMGSRRLSKAADVAEALRGWQDYHMDGRGWSDIAYQVAVDQAGRAWTLRGLRTQSGANGDNDVNERFGATLLILGTGETPSPALIATTQGVIADFRKLYPDGTAIKPHSAVRPAGTDCPGDEVRALIEAGRFEPGHTTQEDWFDMATQAEVQAAFEAALTKVGPKVVEAGVGAYMARFYKDESGTGDAIWDDMRADAKTQAELLGQIAANTKPAS